MSLTISVRSDIKKAQKELKRLGKTAVPKAAARALNRTATGVRTDLSRSISTSASIKPQRLVKDNISIRKAHQHHLEAVLTGRGKPFNLIRFKAKQNKTGVAATAWGKRKTYRGAFIANKGRTVFARTSAKRLPIKALWGPGLANEMKRDYAQIVARKSIATRWSKNFDHELSRLANRGR